MATTDGDTSDLFSSQGSSRAVSNRNLVNVSRWYPDSSCMMEEEDGQVPRQVPKSENRVSNGFLTFEWFPYFFGQFQGPPFFLVSLSLFPPRHAIPVRSFGVSPRTVMMTCSKECAIPVSSRPPPQASQVNPLSLYESSPRHAGHLPCVSAKMGCLWRKKLASCLQIWQA